MDTGHAEHEFALDPHELGGVRAWVLEALPPLCDLREDAVLAVSEIAGNAARHGRARTTGRVTIEHGDGAVWCEVFEPGPPRGRVRADPAALEEMAALARLPDGALLPDGGLLADGAGIEVEDLLEAGRGLPLVRALCGERFTIVETPRGRRIHFGLSGCLCQIRARHRGWRVLPPPGPDRVEPWRAIRLGFPDVEGGDVAELLVAIKKAEASRP
jgi:hypothetical protein